MIVEPRSLREVRHYTFMLEGLEETGRALRDRRIRLVVQKGAPVQIALGAGRHAAVIVCDRGFHRHQKAWRRQVAHEVRCQVMQVESDVPVLVETADLKAKYAARTIRPKIRHLLSRFFPSGTSQARKRFRAFIAHKLKRGRGR